MPIVVVGAGVLVTWAGEGMARGRAGGAGLMVLPKRLEINIPPAVTAVAEAAVGREAVMRAVASAVLQADALENALMAALPLGPQSAAGGVCLPTHFNGELSVNTPFSPSYAVCSLPLLVAPPAVSDFPRFLWYLQAVQILRVLLSLRWILFSELLFFAFLPSLWPTCRLCGSPSCLGHCGTSRSSP